MPGTTKKPAARRKRQPTLDDLQEANRILTAENNQLRGRVEDLRERLNYADDAKASAREASAQLVKEAERLRTELVASKDARFEVARLEGVLQGLERAGKIDPPKDPYASGIHFER